MPILQKCAKLAPTCRGRQGWPLCVSSGRLSNMEWTKRRTAPGTLPFTLPFQDLLNPTDLRLDRRGVHFVSSSVTPAHDGSGTGSVSGGSRWSEGRQGVGDAKGRARSCVLVIFPLVIF